MHGYGSEIYTHTSRTKRDIYDFQTRTYAGNNEKYYPRRNNEKIEQTRKLRLACVVVDSRAEVAAAIVRVRIGRNNVAVLTYHTQHKKTSNKGELKPTKQNESNEKQRAFVFPSVSATGL